MPRAARRVSESGIYHVVVRGNGRQSLFEDDADRLAFLAMLDDATDKNGVRVLAWCLMRNHVHLVLEEAGAETGEAGAGAALAGGALAAAMKALETRYAQRYNKRHDHVGHVFQQRFHSSPIESEGYLLEAVRYVHNNPAKAGVCPAAEYPWSSYHEYVGRAEHAETGLVLGLLGSPEQFERFTDDEQAGAWRPASRVRIPDGAAGEVAAEVLGPVRAADLKGLEKPRRDALICDLWDAGLSVRQIERLTGIGRGIVERARKR